MRQGGRMIDASLRFGICIGITGAQLCVLKKRKLGGVICLVSGIWHLNCIPIAATKLQKNLNKTKNK